MKKSFDLKKVLMQALPIAVFLVVALIYCKPALQGLQIEQHDFIQWKAMAKDAENYLAKNGEYPQWVNTMFAGMPSYNIAFNSNAIVPYYVVKVLSLWLPQPFMYFFMACIAFYFLSQVLRIRPWIGVLAALGFAYCSYDPIIIVVGHHTKMVTIALMPALLGALIMLYEKKYWLGGALAALFTSAMVVNNHLQIIYYMMIVIGFMTLAYIIEWIKKGEWKTLVTAGSIATVAAVLGALTCAVQLFTTYDYSKESMRGGKANLLSDTASATAAKTTTGLDIDYAFRWSYGIPETFTLLVPNVNGGASKSLGEESRFYETIMEKIQTGAIDQNSAQQVAQFGTEYWGDQPFTSGPVYMGAIICLLFILGMFTSNNRHRWWALAASLFGIVLAWGSNFMGFNSFLFEYMPMYDKFRAPSQSLVIPQLLFPMIGMIGLQHLLFNNQSNAQKAQILKWTGITMGAIILLVVFYYFSADFASANEKSALKEITASNPTLAAPVKDVFKAAGEDRKSLFGSDLVRSLLLIGAGFALLWLAFKQKIKPMVAIMALLVLSTFDLLAIGKRYLNDDSYAEKENTEADGYLAASNPGLYKALSSIQQQDPDIHFRVFNTTSDPFNDALTSAMVRSVGGYHPAKLSIYQDLIEHQLSKQNMNVYNMLNTKYFVVPGQQGPQVQQNPGAMGAAWFVKQLHFVPDARAEMKSLDSLNLTDTAIIQEMYRSEIKNNPVWDSAASIKLQVYDNNEISYVIIAPTNQFAVLSEVYYSRGWNAYVDGKQTPVVKTNYALRGVSIPAGTKLLELKFEPVSFKTGSLVTTISSVILLLLLAFAIFIEIKGSRKPTGNVEKV